MFINHELICSVVFKEQQTTTKLNGMQYCITNFEILRDAAIPYSEHSLYIVDDLKTLSSYELIKNMNLLIMSPDSENPEQYFSVKHFSVNYSLVDITDENIIKLKLRDFFDIYNEKGYMANLVLDHLFDEKGIQDMVDEFYTIFNNPVFVFDAGYNLIAANWEIALENEKSSSMAKKMRVTNDDWEIINNYSPSNDEILLSNIPVKVYHEAYGFNQLVCSIDTKNTLGVIVIDEINRPFKDVDIELLEMLRDGICQKMRMDAFMQNNRGYPYEYFIRDLLDRKIAMQYLEGNRFDYVNKEFSENNICMVIEAAKTPTILNTYLLQRELESIYLKTKTIMYNGEIVVIFSLNDGETIDETIINEIDALCKKNNLYAGVSNTFPKIKYVYDYYKQAIRAIELGQEKSDEPGLFMYKKFNVRHLITTFLKTEEKMVYCNPQLKIIMNYDLEHGTDLAYSLYMYLINERNVAAAAKMMYVHRNTLLYRLQKIDDMVNITYDDPMERQYVILSYEMCCKNEENV